MNLLYFVRLLQKNFKWMLILGVGMAVAVYLLTMNLPREWESETELYSGVSTQVNLGDVGPTRLDFLTVNAKIDNILNTIKSRQTLEQVATELLAYHISLGPNPNPRFLSEESARELEEYFSEETLSYWRALARDEDNIAVLHDAINDWKNENVRSETYHKVFIGESSPYGLKALGKVSAMRVGGSDLIRITYRWRDPAVAQKTLSLLVKILIENIRGISLQQSRDVVAYFERKLAEAIDDLEFAEGEMKEFREENNILNYNEQTEAIALMKERMEDEYQKELATLEAARAAMNKLEKQLEANKELLKYSRQLLLVKDKIAEIQRKIAIIEVGYQDDKLLESLRVEEAKLESQLKADLLNRSAYERTTDGVDIKALLEQWVETSLALDASMAKVKIYDERRAYFDKVYKSMAPLGSRLSKLDRKIAIKEEHYLEVLHGLNQAVLHQQTLSLSTDGLRTTVEPTFPSKPLPSKRALLIALSFILGFMLPYVVAFLRDLLDQSIKTRRRAEFFTKKKVIAGFPAKAMIATSLEIDEMQLNRKAVNQLIQLVRNEYQREQPVKINVFSFDERSDKALFVDLISDAFSREGFQFRIADYSGIEEGLQDNYREYMNTSRILGEESQDVVLVIHPNLLGNNYNSSLVDRAAINIYTLSASSIWTPAESTKLEEMAERGIRNEVVALMNVNLYELENIIGEIPKKRSRVRIFIKRLLRLQMN